MMEFSNILTDLRLEGSIFQRVMCLDDNEFIQVDAILISYIYIIICKKRKYILYN